MPARRTKELLEKSERKRQLREHQRKQQAQLQLEKPSPSDSLESHAVSKLSARDRARIELARALQHSHSEQERRDALLGKQSVPGSETGTDLTPRGVARAKLTSVMRNAPHRQ